jgi:DNA polymerase-3 subunit gamma/tau
MAEFERTELHLKHRPAQFKEVIGQSVAAGQLYQMLASKRVPHALGLFGPSGVGKTTLARIVAAKLGCSMTQWDLLEINAADDRGIDAVRDIRKAVGRPPVVGSTCVWIIDEAQGLTKDAQNAMLKVLEDGIPQFAYFILCTTEPGKLLPTIKTRLTSLTLNLLNSDDMDTLVTAVAKREGIELSVEVRDGIIQAAGGSPRMALVKLGMVREKSKVEDQLAILGNGVSEADVAAIEIVRLLMKPGCKWTDVATLLSGCNEDPEKIRHLVLNYAAAPLLKGQVHKRAVLILEAFRFNFYDSGRPGLIHACYSVCSNPEK